MDAPTSPSEFGALLKQHGSKVLRALEVAAVMITILVAIYAGLTGFSWQVRLLIIVVVSLGGLLALFGLMLLGAVSQLRTRGSRIRDIQAEVEKLQRAQPTDSPSKVEGLEKQLVEALTAAGSAQTELGRVRAARDQAMADAQRQTAEAMAARAGLDSAKMDLSRFQSRAVVRIGFQKPVGIFDRAPLIVVVENLGPNLAERVLTKAIAGKKSGETSDAWDVGYQTAMKVDEKRQYQVCTLGYVKGWDWVDATLVWEYAGGFSEQAAVRWPLV